MFKYFLAAWKANHGNRLIVSAAVAFLLVGGVWHFDLLPDIELVSPDAPESDAKPDRPPATMLFIAVVTPNSVSTSMTGIVRIHNATGNVTVNTEPIISREFQVGTSGVEAIVINELPQGRYSALAFLDLNGNGQLDSNSQGTPVEPLRLSQTPGSEFAETGVRDASFRLRPSDPVSITFNFQIKPAAN